MAGAVVGGFVSGSLSDRLGRIRVLTWTILVFAVFTALCGFARGYWDLVAYDVALSTDTHGLIDFAKPPIAKSSWIR
jgi:MFS family permease